jgi:hypothetical protein
MKRMDSIALLLVAFITLLVILLLSILSIGWARTGPCANEIQSIRPIR